MSGLSKITLTGRVLRNPEKRFTEDNLAISSFSLNFADEEEGSDEKVVNVFTFGRLADRAAETIKKGQKIVVEGKLQTNVVKTESGTDKKFFEINAQGIEILEKNPQSDTNTEENEEKSFELNEEVDSNDLIGDDEIPF